MAMNIYTSLLPVPTERRLAAYWELGEFYCSIVA